MKPKVGYVLKKPPACEAEGMGIVRIFNLWIYDAKSRLRTVMILLILRVVWGNFNFWDTIAMTIQKFSWKSWAACLHKMLYPS